MDFGYDNYHKFCDIIKMTEEEGSQPIIYKPLAADDDDQGVMEIESLCVRCEQNGITKIMCTKIPFYKQVILMSFLCEHCGYRNNEIQSGEPAQEHGTKITVTVKDAADLNRQVIKSEYAAITIPEIELEIPYRSQPGEVTTIEGVLQRTKTGLLQDQEVRKVQDPEGAQKIDDFIVKLDSLNALERPFTLILDDPTGNCFVENPNPWHVDPRSLTVHYARTLMHTKLLGLADDDAVPETSDGSAPEWNSPEDAKNEVLHFPSDCPNCGAKVETLMKPTDVPYFQTVIIMATTCDACGHRTNEVKSGSAIKEHGYRLSLRIEKEEDLKRDVLKSDTCNMAIPELDFQVGWGALSSRFTTVEGLLTATKEQLGDQSSLSMGDSAPEFKRQQMSDFLAKIDDILALKLIVTLVLDDPAGNSYIQSLAAPLDDPRLSKDYYTRSYEQNDELGLNDMKTENYEQLEPVTEDGEDGEPQS